MKKCGERFLIVYSGFLTVVFAVAAIYGFGRQTQKMSLEELDVQRINLREPDGTLRLIISDAKRAPGSFIHGKEYPRPDRKVAGMIFLNEEGTENGGLLFGGDKSADGIRHSYGHLSFDGYEQDQTLAIDSSQDGNDKSTRFEITDRPDFSIEDLFKLDEAVKALPKEKQDEALNSFFRQHGTPVTRLVIGSGMDSKSGDNGVMIRLNDANGKPRILMKVASDGTPSLEMLDAHGKVVKALMP